MRDRDQGQKEDPKHVSNLNKSSMSPSLKALQGVQIPRTKAHKSLGANNKHNTQLPTKQRRRTCLTCARFIQSSWMREGTCFTQSPISRLETKYGVDTGTYFSSLICLEMPQTLWSTSNTKQLWCRNLL